MLVCSTEIYDILAIGVCHECCNVDRYCLLVPRRHVDGVGYWCELSQNRVWSTPPVSQFVSFVASEGCVED